MTDSLFPRLVLAKGREKSLLRRHPWIFSGGVARMEGKARSGETIDIVDHQGKWLAPGAAADHRARHEAVGRYPGRAQDRLLPRPA